MPYRFRLLALWLLALLPAAATLAAPLLDWEKVADYPHRSRAFTQGLQLDGDTLLESSGLYGQSFITRWQPDQTAEPHQWPIPSRLFAEGITRLGDRIYLLTWQSQQGLVYDAASMQLIRSFHYRGEGWGLTTDGSQLIMSDGSDQLRLLDPQTLRVTGRIKVRDSGAPVVWLNELEWLPAGAIDPQPRLLANIWQSDRIVVIDPASGEVTAELDLGDLYPDRMPGDDVLNGVAWDPRDGTLLVTGKRWPRLYRLRLSPPSAPATVN